MNLILPRGSATPLPDSRCRPYPVLVVPACLAAWIRTTCPPRTRLTFGSDIPYAGSARLRRYTNT